MKEIVLVGITGASFQSGQARSVVAFFFSWKELVTVEWDFRWWVV